MRSFVKLKPNSITPAGSKLVADQLWTSFEPDSVMEFGLYSDFLFHKTTAAADCDVMR